MSVSEIVRAWTDEDARDELAAIPENPAGSVDAEVDQLLGAFDPDNRTEAGMTRYSRRPCCF